MINPNIFKSYDIRGLWPKDINEKNIDQIAKAIASFLIKNLQKEKLTLVLGRDMRFSSPVIFERIKKVFLSYGTTIYDLGLVPTPTVYFSIFRFNADSGIQISASHNPKDYNGIKIAVKDGKKLIKVGKNTGMNEIKERALNNNFIKAKSSFSGKVIEVQDAVDFEIETAFSDLKINNLKKLKLIVDPANAMGILYFNKLKEKLPLKIEMINDYLDGSFPAHQADPLQFDLWQDLQKKVVEKKADLGIMVDGDADRIFFVDEKGKIVPATLTTSLILEKIFALKPKSKVLVDIRYILNVKNQVEKIGGILSISPVGHALITKQLNEEKAVFAGESSGHYYFEEIGGGESSIRVVLLILQILSEKNKPFSKLKEEVKTAHESGEINFIREENVSPKEILEKVTKNFADGEISWLDGLSVSYGALRFNIRASNTEPLLRLNVEGFDKKEVEEKTKKLINLLLSLGLKKH
jgi:phosphomannomutase